MKPGISRTRRVFLKHALSAVSGACVVSSQAYAFRERRKEVMTINGMIDASDMQTTLPHEHILVDFIGAEDVNPPRWERDIVIEKMLPYLKEAKNEGCRTFIDCTPNFLGRDVGLLKQLSEKSGLFIITNTGYYGGSDHKFLPAHAFTETDEQLAERWIQEWQTGIDGTGIKPGFIKISVNPSHLSDMSLKLIQAAALTHRKTGLTIASHTGPATAAFEQIEVLKMNRVDPAAFIWVHAQNEQDPQQYVKAAMQGAWISLDGLRDNNVSEYVSKLLVLKRERCLHKVLISHDAGWYDPAKQDGGDITPFTTLFRKLIPALEMEEFSESEVLQLIKQNTANAFAIGVKKWKGNRK